MESTKLSSKGQVIIPKTVRSAHHWEPGLELVVIDMGEGILLKPKAPFPVSTLTNVAGMLKGRIQPKTDEEIESAMASAARRAWRDSH